MADSHRNERSRCRAEVDQLLAGAHRIGDDGGLKMLDLFSVFDSIESLDLSGRELEAELSSQV